MLDFEYVDKTIKESRKELYALYDIETAFKKAEEYITFKKEVHDTLNLRISLVTERISHFQEELKKIQDNCEHKNTVSDGYDSHYNYERCVDCGEVFKC